MTTKTEILYFPDEPSWQEQSLPSPDPILDQVLLRRIHKLMDQLVRQLDSHYLALTELGPSKTTSPLSGRTLLYDALNGVYDELQDAIPADRLGLALLGDEKEKQVHAVWARAEGTKILINEGFSAPLAGSSLERIAESGHPRIISDLQLYLEQHPESTGTRLIVEEGMLSSLTCPLSILGQTVGFLFFSSMTANTYNIRHVALFMNIAEKIAFLVKKANAYGELLDFNSGARNLLYPVLEEAGEPPPSTAPRQLRNREIRRIFCADHEAIIQLLLSRLLKDEGYQVEIFNSGMPLLEHFIQDPCDLIIVGADMPGLSGFDVCSRIRHDQRNRGVPLILILRDDDRENISKSLECGATDVLYTPIRAAELLGKISLLHQKRNETATVEIGTAPGSIFSGSYRIVQQIGSGGSGTVFYALDISREPHRPLALKVIELPMHTGQRHRSRLLREAYEHSRLKHPNIVELIDFGQVGGIYFLAMEYVEGLTLTEMVEDTGPLSEDTLLFVAMEVLKALRYFNENHLIHRDIKAANIMVGTDGDVKLLDFGLIRNEDDATLSADDEFHGTPLYSAPEYILGEGHLDIRTDIYSLGVTLYYAASGTYPITGVNIRDVFRSHIESEIEPLHQRVPEISSEFSSLISTMLAKNPAARPSPRQAFREVLHLLRENSPE